MSTAEKMQFQAEARQVLDLMIHSLYTNKDIFLRELISNASDALDRLRVESLTRENLLGKDEIFEIVIETDSEARTVTVHDSGIGMTREEVIENIGTIAKSGTRELVETLKDKSDELAGKLIGQFGVGFYAAFMVADKVSLLTRRAGEEGAALWESDGRRRVHDLGSHQVQARHVDHAPSEAQRRGKRHRRLYRRIRRRAHRQAVFGLRRLSHHLQGRWEERENGRGSETDQFDETHLVPSSIGSDRRRLHGVLQAHQPRLERAVDASVIQGRRAHRVPVAPVPAFQGPDGSVFRQREVRTSTLRPQCSDHGELRGSASPLPAVRQGHGRFVGSAPEHFAPAASGRPAHQADPQVDYEESHRRVVGHGARLQGQIRGLLGTFWTGSERRRRLRLRERRRKRFRQQGQAHAVAAVRLLGWNRQEDHTRRIRRTHAARAEEYLLSHRRIARNDRELASPGSVHGKEDRGSVSQRPDRRDDGAGAVRVRRKGAQIRRQGYGRSWQR